MGPEESQETIPFIIYTFKTQSFDMFIEQKLLSILKLHNYDEM